jgi:hypothetical protein
MSVAQSFGISTPASIEARMIEVPSGTVIDLPSTTSVTCFSERDAKIVRKMIDRAHHRIWGEPPESAKRSELHGVAEVGDQLDLLCRLDVPGDPVERLDAALRADAAGRALAAAFDGAELHGETRLLQHVGRIVEYHDAGVADQPVLGREGLIVERRVEQSAREVRSERPADLHRLHRPAGSRAAADLVDDLAERQAEGRLEQAAMLHVAGDLDRDSAARPAHAEIFVIRAASVHDDGHGCQRDHVVDHRRLAEQSLDSRQRRLGAHDAALAFERIHQRRFLAADIGAGAGPNLDVEGIGRA